VLGRYDRYAAFLCCLTFAQRARCAAAILLRPARLIVRTGVGTARLVFAHRAFCASEIFLRSAADSVRFELFILIRMPVPFRPTKLPMTWMTWSRRLRSRSKDRYFRWHDSGDLQSIEHLRNIVAVCMNLPRVKFWLPTREYQTVEAYRRMGGHIPTNLCIRYSAHLVDGAPPIQYGLPTSTVVSTTASDSEDRHACPAPRQNMKCGSCRACWNPTVKVVSYQLKWVSRTSREVAQ